MTSADRLAALCKQHDFAQQAPASQGGGIQITPLRRYDAGQISRTFTRSGGSQ